MASPPKRTRFANVLDPDEAKATTEGLNQFCDATVQCLSKGLTFSENFLGGFIDFAMSAPPTATVRIATALSSAPLAVLFVGLWRTLPTRAAIPLAAPFAWDWSAGSITTDSFLGLSAGSSYTARLLVIQR